MVDIAEKHKSKIKALKDKVEESAMYFDANYKRFDEFFNFIFKTCLTPQDLENLATLMKPNLEFNCLEAYISRLRGEFADYEPSPKISAADGVSISMLTPKFIKTMKVLEAHLREIYSNATNDCLAYNIFTDQVAGGYSVMKVGTEYVNEMSFEQNIKLSRVFDPTLVGFDPMARDSHKGDGSYCFEIIPRTKEDFEAEFGKEALKGVAFTRGLQGVFNWSYKNEKQEIVKEVDFYEKQCKREKIVKLSNGASILKKHYEPIVEHINELGLLQAAPVVLEERWTQIETIHRYRFFENEVLEHTETSYKYLPLVFFDGNSVVIKEDESGTSCQMTRPQVYHAKGMQKLKNFAGQTIAAEIENMKMQTWVASKDAIPPEYLDGYINPQKASVLVFNEFLNGNKDVRLTPPREVQRTETPALVTEIFANSDGVIQGILGSYDAHQGNIVNGELSGKAIQAGALQSNMAAMPYLVGYIKGLNRVSEIIIDLIPKYYVTPRTIPIRDGSGKRKYTVINDERDENSIFFNYDPNSLQVKVEAGPNGALQKQQALEQIVRLMGTSEIFSQFMNSEGLDILFENIDIRGGDELKQKALEFMAKARQAAEESKGQPDPTQQLIETQKEIEFAKVEQRREANRGDLAIKTAQLAIDEQKAYAEFLKVQAEVEATLKKSELEELKIRSENAKDAIEMDMALVQEMMGI